MKRKENLIADLRKEAGYTQKSLAEALHITDKAVSKWERGLSLPDVSLLPKLSLLLGVDMSLLLSSDSKPHHEGWMGLIDLRNNPVDLRQTIYDKPLVYFMLMHFLLLDVRKICFLCHEENQTYLKQDLFADLGFSFTFRFEDCLDHNLMVLNGPHFLFGSDLTRQFQGAMVSGSVTVLVPDYTAAPFMFCPAEYVPLYKKSPAYLYGSASQRTLGRGMLCLKADQVDAFIDAAAFVRIYQKNSGFLIGSLEEIAYKKGIISQEKLQEIAAKVPYGEQLRRLADPSVSKPKVG